MKLIITTFTLLLITLSSIAQIKKGQWLAGWELDFSGENRKAEMPATWIESKVSDFGFSPGIGYFVADGLAVGVRFVVGNKKNEQDYRNLQLTGYETIERTTSKSTPFGVSPFVRYYFLPATKKLNLFADASYVYSIEKTSVEHYSYFGLPGNAGGGNVSISKAREKMKGHSFTIAGGPAIFLSPRFSVELAVGYSTGKLNGINFDDIKTNRFFVGTGFHVSL